MAKGGQKEIESNLINVGSLTLEPAGLRPNGIIVSGEMLMVTDENACKVNVYRRRDGVLLFSTDKLESKPYGVCCVNETTICVAQSNGTIQLMSVQDMGVINKGRTFNMHPSFDHCHGVAAFSDKIAVFGVKDNAICWCVVSIQDGPVDRVNNICEGWMSYLTTKDDMIYIACSAGNFSPESNGVYGFNVHDLRQPPFRYKPDGLSLPSGITVDDYGFLFLCVELNSIHHLTDKCELVAIYREGIPCDPHVILWDSGILYVTGRWSNVITLYQTDNAAIPAEILRMDNRSIKLFKEAMKDGKANVYNIRVMVVGHVGVGKTTLIKRLLEKEVNINERQCTEGIVVHVHCCKVSHDALKWSLNKEDSEQDVRLRLLANVLNIEVQKRNSTHERVNQDETLYPKEQTGLPESHDFHLQDVSSNTSAPFESDKIPSDPSNQLGVQDTNSATGKVNDDPAMEILQLLHDKADKLKQGSDIPLTIVDFAGQFAFYTTHQTFLTDRAIYLLVSDISKQVTDPVTDDCYFDTEGIKLCKVYELVEVWLNSIHSGAPSPEGKTPPVILVGTHVDQIQQDSREEVCQRYFRQIRFEHLGTNPSIVHLADEDYAIDNTIIDPKLNLLKQKIIQIASEQPYWGEAIPVRWLVLEEHLLSLKTAGVKVIPYSSLVEMNQKEAVKIESREELDLFLKFQHAIGNILYFGTEDLKEQIMLDPQWLIYSLRTIITAENFILKKIKTPAVIQKWQEFKKTAKLTQELIDAIWTKESNPDCHDNKDLLLRLMEKLNIIARPLSFSNDGDAVKENCFLAPCMLQEKMPAEVICPKPNDQMESSPVLCYVFTGNFLPSPIFHRLLAACVAQWPIATKKKEEMQENLIFCGCCVFQLDHYHKLTLFFREYVIFVRVTRMGIKDKTPSSKLCIEVREFISTKLFNITGYLAQSLKFEHFIQCPAYSGVSINSLIPVSILQHLAEVRCDFHDHILESRKILNFWFEDQQRIVAIDEECQKSFQNRALPQGKKYHVFFSYSCEDIQWVKKSVERLEQDGYVCCEYDRDNTPGMPLLTFAEHSIRDAYKTVVVMTKEAFTSGFVLLEIDMAIAQGFDEKRNCVVPVLLKDCDVPLRLSALNYVDARDPNQSNVYWPKLLRELQSQGEDNVPEVH